MARQKSEDRVLLEGGVIPAERAGSSPGSQGKAIPVEQTAGQLRLPIATAENPKGAAWRAPADRSAVSELRVTEAIVNVESVTPVTMEEVVSRVTAAFVKVVLNKGAPGPDGQTVDELLVQLPTLGPRLAAALIGGTIDPVQLHEREEGAVGEVPGRSALSTCGTWLSAHRDLRPE